ncbi:MAG: toxin-antitoxin system HicB family antitoxin [Spirochaetaceae bacterium]|nr:toxin-antitoxin system HicB family antitoxin [Spirochaetaceae bacterium]
MPETGARPNPYAYNITVRECEFEGEPLFEARIKELPDVREFAESAQDAYALAIDTIETAAAMFAETGRPFPLPVRPQDQYSGRVTLRLPKSLHRELASAAEEEGVSLNQHLVTALVSHARGVPAQDPDRRTRV